MYLRYIRGSSRPSQSDGIEHRFIKRLTKPGMGFGSFNTAQRTLRGMEAMNMSRKGQVQAVDKGDVFGIAQ